MVQSFSHAVLQTFQPLLREQLRANDSRPTILIIGSQRLIRWKLEASGYRVFEVQDSLDAVVLLQALQWSVDMVITEVFVARMNGRRFFRLLGLNDRIKLLLLAECDEDLATQWFGVDASTTVISKRAGLDQVLKEVRRLLETDSTVRRSFENTKRPVGPLAECLGTACASLQGNCFQDYSFPPSRRGRVPSCV